MTVFLIDRFMLDIVAGIGLSMQGVLSMAGMQTVPGTNTTTHNQMIGVGSTSTSLQLYIGKQLVSGRCCMHQ